MHWTRSGDLIVMVVLGGMGSTFGPRDPTSPFEACPRIRSYAR